MTTTTNPLNLNDLYRFDAIQALLLRTVLEKAQQFPVQECKDFLILMKSTRWYAISSDSEFASIWDKIRNDQFVTDFVLDTTIDFELQLRVNDLPTLEQLGEQVGQSIDQLKQSNPNNKVDLDFSQRKPQEGMAVVMKANPWLTVCYFMSRIDLKAVSTVMDNMNRAVAPKKE